jgi:hypothetical protein
VYDYLNLCIQKEGFLLYLQVVFKMDLFDDDFSFDPNRSDTFERTFAEPPRESMMPGSNQFSTFHSDAGFHSLDPSVEESYELDGLGKVAEEDEESSSEGEDDDSSSGEGDEDDDSSEEDDDSSEEDDDSEEDSDDDDSSDGDDSDSDEDDEETQYELVSVYETESEDGFSDEDMRRESHPLQVKNVEKTLAQRVEYVEAKERDLERRERRHRWLCRGGLCLLFILGALGLTVLIMYFAAPDKLNSILGIDDDGSEQNINKEVPNSPTPAPSPGSTPAPGDSDAIVAVSFEILIPLSRFSPSNIDRYQADLIAALDLLANDILNDIRGPSTRRRLQGLDVIEPSTISNFQRIRKFS